MSTVSTRPSTAQPHWAFKIGQTVCSLPQAPSISSTGQIVLAADAAFILSFQNWLSAWVAGKVFPVNGEIIAHDFNFHPKVRYAFKQAWPSRLAFPALDGSLQSPGRLTVTLQALAVMPMAASGGAAGP